MHAFFKIQNVNTIRKKLTAFYMSTRPSRVRHLFLAYAFARTRNVDLFNASQMQLDRAIQVQFDQLRYAVKANWSNVLSMANRSGSWLF